MKFFSSAQTKLKKKKKQKRKPDTKKHKTCKKIEKKNCLWRPQFIQPYPGKKKKVGKTHRKKRKIKINKIEKQGKFVLLVKKRGNWI